MRASRGCVEVLCVLSLTTGGVRGQWVDFADETAGRLVLTPVLVTDALEKDITVVDLNKDGWEDLVVVRKTPFSVAAPQTDVLL
ncbi:MAG: hypothetical protein ACE5E1_09730, partial [Phycisphaerae bacterium]